MTSENVIWNLRSSSTLNAILLVQFSCLAMIHYSETHSKTDDPIISQERVVDFASKANTLLIA